MMHPIDDDNFIGNHFICLFHVATIHSLMVYGSKRSDNVASCLQAFRPLNVISIGLTP